MAKSLFSSSWYRVADLKPRLRGHAEILRQQFRGQLWYVLQDHASGRFHRFSPSAYLIIGLMDGSRTVQKLWEIAAERLGECVDRRSQRSRILEQRCQVSKQDPRLGKIRHIADIASQLDHGSNLLVAAARRCAARPAQRSLRLLREGTTRGRAGSPGGGSRNAGAVPSPDR